MNADQIADWLAAVQYRPGWIFTTEIDPYEGVKVRIVVDALNSYTPEPIVLGIDSYVPPCDSPTQFYDWLLWRLHRIESHECREWFRVDGTAWKNPHR